ncbi:MAG: N-6 DNA methylase, partial [Candidatus Aenigmarchaeota archaeon]|nr:N-6 DNA methylase [Candidatus Aenigmarchaeota archaeon]
MERGFPDRVLSAFEKLGKEIDASTAEHDMRMRFVRFFVEDVLGYRGREYEAEKKRTDVTIFDENGFRPIVIETKKPAEPVSDEKHVPQAFKYADGSTRYVGLTNGLQLRIWEHPSGKSCAAIDFQALKGKRFADLAADAQQGILFLEQLTRLEIRSPKKYTQFNERYARIDVKDERGFAALIPQLQALIERLNAYTLGAFAEHQRGYGEYVSKTAELEEARKKLSLLSGSRKQDAAYYLQREAEKAEAELGKYKAFAGYRAWRDVSGREGRGEDENRKVFCQESVYVLLNKLLFIRICEDKGILPKNISNGGIEVLLHHLAGSYAQLVKAAYGSASVVYGHFYEKNNLLEWYLEGDGGLEEALNRTLWVLNQFGFAQVDRDILGSIYEKFLPKEERKKLGEFYTPVDVVDYILDAVGYVPAKDIEGLDLLDPACGSGTFLVRAANRLVDRFLRKFGKTSVAALSPGEAKAALEAVAEHIHGFDINPFACHIAEMNLLFQVIDLWQRICAAEPRYRIPRFRVYRTDSLELPQEQRELHLYNGGSYRSYAHERDAVDALKRKKYDLVVGNPPYVNIKQIPEGYIYELKKNYKSVFGRTDLYVPFIELGLRFLKPKAKLGYITSNKFAQSDYGRNLRKLIAGSHSLERFIDFGDSGVFADATNYPCILVIKNIVEPGGLIHVVVKAQSENIFSSIERAEREGKEDDSVVALRIPRSSLNENSWNFQTKKESRIIAKMNMGSKKLAEIALGIRQGISSGADEAFIINKTAAQRLEKDITFPLCGGREIKRWRILWEGNFTVYPYDSSGTLLEMRKYPMALNHILKFKAILEKRYCVERGGKELYEYDGPRYNSVYEGEEKIITPDISKKSNFSLAGDVRHFKNTCYVINLQKDTIPTPKFLLGVLNSSLIEFYIKQVSPFVSGGYYRYKTQYLEDIPIWIPRSLEEKRLAKQIEQRVERILALMEAVPAEKRDIASFAGETGNLARSELIETRLTGRPLEEPRLSGRKVLLNEHDAIICKDAAVAAYLHVLLKGRLAELAAA